MTTGTEPSEIEKIEDAAGLWFARRLDREGPTGRVLYDLTEEREFEAWLNQDPRHRDAYALMARAADDVIWVAPSPVSQPNTASSVKRQRLAFGALAAVLVLGLVGAGVTQYLVPEWQTTRTAVGETRLLSLEDGTKITLSAKSAVRIAYSGQERRVYLKYGEAFFAVQHNAQRPFNVMAGDAVISDIGTQFNVNLRQASVEVNVVEGEVAVSSLQINNAHTATPATAGHRVRMTRPSGQMVDGTANSQSNGSGSPSTMTSMVVEAVNPQDQIALREGRQVYQDARLGDIVEDINRYYAPGVSIADQRLAEKRLTATLMPRDVDAFLAALPIAAGVKVKQDSQGSILIQEPDASGPGKL